MARDGLLPRSLARVSGRGSPVRITLFTAVIVAALAGIVPLDELAALANAGTLTAFIAVCLCMLIMRHRAPDAPRKFRTPLPWVVGIGGSWAPLPALQPAMGDHRDFSSPTARAWSSISPTGPARGSRGTA